MNFEIQALGGKLIGSRSALKTLDRLTTLLPNSKVSVETLTIPTEIESDEDDDITLAELKEQLEDNMTLAELQDRLLTEEEEEVPAPIEWDDEMTYYSRTCGELRNF